MIEYTGTRDVQLSELRSFPGNAKRGDVPAITESLRANGQYRSLVVREEPDGTLTVLAGNHTMQALAQLGSAVARCETLRCDDRTALRINLADNRTAELGTTDEDALRDLLAALEDDWAGTGYEPSGWDAGQPEVPQDEHMPDPGDAQQTESVSTWGVIVTCRDEAEQTGLLESFLAQGLVVRALIG